MSASTTPQVLTPGEVAQKFRVDVKTVGRWAKEGRIPSFRTPGGHRRFHTDAIEALLRGETGGAR
ncbi:BldC family transcriptional regulator [Micrococcus luteus]|uniref:BldC family transcriptional regulator n=1 Tax=Micrococcus luteus TaxID=1270 RepID=UPI0033192AA6